MGPRETGRDAGGEVERQQRFAAALIAPEEGQRAARNAAGPEPLLRLLGQVGKAAERRRQRRVCRNKLLADVGLEHFLVAAALALCQAESSQVGNHR